MYLGLNLFNSPRDICISKVRVYYNGDDCVSINIYA